MYAATLSPPSPIQTRPRGRPCKHTTKSFPVSNQSKQEPLRGLSGQSSTVGSNPDEAASDTTLDDSDVFEEASQGNSVIGAAFNSRHNVHSEKSTQSLLISQPTGLHQVPSKNLDCQAGSPVSAEPDEHE